jgi:hypothetical protein
LRNYVFLTQETWFFAVFSTATKYSRKNRVFDRIKTKETGFFAVLPTVTNYSRKNPVSDYPRVSLILLTANRRFGFPF